MYSLIEMRTSRIRMRVCNTTTIPFYPPVVTTTQRDAMTVTAGAMVYNSSTNKLKSKI